MLKTMEPTIFTTYEEAEKAYYEENPGMPLTDDSDKEEARFERWLESNGHSIMEGNI